MLGTATVCGADGADRCRATPAPTVSATASSIMPIVSPIRLLLLSMEHTFNLLALRFVFLIFYDTIVTMNAQPPNTTSALLAHHCTCAVMPMSMPTRSPWLCGEDAP